MRITNVSLVIRVVKMVRFVKIVSVVTQSLIKICYGHSGAIRVVSVIRIIQVYSRCQNLFSHL